MLGHILTLKFFNPQSWRYEFQRYSIIGTFTDRFGRVSYYVPLWDAELGFFRAFSERNHNFVGISETAMPLSENAEQAAAYIRYNRIASYCETIRHAYAVPAYTIEKQAIGQNNVYGTRFTLQDDCNTSVFDTNEAMNRRAATKRNYYAQLAQSALLASGYAETVNA